MSDVLVLNKTWQAMGAVSRHKAITMLTTHYTNGAREPKAKAIFVADQSYVSYTWDDWSKLKVQATDDVIRSSTSIYLMPQVIHLTRYEKIPKQRGSFSRRTLFQRDGFLCQYCGCRPGTEELTVDHVVPRVQGGKTEWENCVASCIECNAKKAGRTPKQAGMKLNCVPQKPPYNIFKGRCKLHKSWEPFLKHIDNFEDLLSEAYWDVPLH